MNASQPLPSKSAQNVPQPSKSAILGQHHHPSVQQARNEEVYTFDDTWRRIKSDQTYNPNAPTPILHISNIKFKQGERKQFEEALLAECSKYGTIQAIKYIHQCSYKHMYLVAFKTISQAIWALAHMHNQSIISKK